MIMEISILLGTNEDNGVMQNDEGPHDTIECNCSDGR